MKSIFIKNFATTALVLTFCFLLLAVSFIGIGRTYLIEDYRRDMMNCAYEVSRTASATARMGTLSDWSLGMAISTIAGSTGNHIFITDEQGVIITCSDRKPLCEHLGFHVSEEILNELEYGSFDEFTTLGDLYPEKRYVAACQISAETDGEVLGCCFVSAKIETMLGTWTNYLTWSIIALSAVSLIAMLVVMFYTRRMARPLDEIAAASRKFARGDFSARVRQTQDTTYEMGALIDSFNKMADSLEQAEYRRSEFVANISHELRTPMTTIAGFADGILDGTIPPEDERKYLTSIRDETRRLSRLVREMLDVSRARTQANAVKFAAPGSCLVLRLYKDNGKAYVAIRDYGETIPPDDLPYIFDRFHKSDHSRSLDKEGVGLGLYLVKTIINAHDEDIAVRSEDGMTEFVFTLALAESARPGKE